ncbi:MAG: hypothetical protein CVU11_10655 [Bacteroidetes bacterium HGW-Bacteroidetes-6]|jgi:hypothetical protein|nr:MAG: hypothetical protein CVU11_10655 [Bacteroidetes bacterium HGW-Bacteroidetes-6]
MINLKKFLLKDSEKYLFLFLVLVNLLPAFAGRFFPTMDGAAHLYNSNLINNLLFAKSTGLSGYFIFNPEVIPNWSGHAILAIFNLFLPAFFAEKILVVIYLIGLPYAYRRFIKQIAPQNVLMSYFIFPFAFSFMFMLGFYNFSLAIIAMFLVFTYWMKNFENGGSWGKVIMLFLLLLVVYFSHIVVFAFTLLAIGIYILFEFLVIWKEKQKLFRKLIKESLNKILMLLIASIVPIILSFLYFNARLGVGYNVYVENNELIDWLKTIRPLIVYNPLVEAPLTSKLGYLIAIIVIIASFIRINELFSVSPEIFWKKMGQALKMFKIQDSWLLLSFLLLFLYFYLPDSDGQAGFVSLRLCYLFFIFLIIWLSTQPLPKWLMVFIVLVVATINVRLVVYYSSVIKEMDGIASSCYDAAEFIEPNSVVLPLNYSDNWLAIHSSNYLGAEKPMVILDNYECFTDYFPLKWNSNSFPNLTLGKLHSAQIPDLVWQSNPNNEDVKIEYVFVLGKTDANLDSIHSMVFLELNSEYKLVFSDENCMLYGSKVNQVN